MSVLAVGSAFLPRNALATAAQRSSPLIRCEAQSALISSQEMPHTFSVYDLKNMSKSRLPNRFVTHCRKLVSGRMGNSRALK
jgi:hypothetical protein